MKAQKFTTIITVLLIFQHTFAIEKTDQVPVENNHQITQPMGKRNLSTKPSWWQQGKTWFYAASAIVTFAVAGVLIHRNLPSRSTEEKALQLEELEEQKPTLQPSVPHVTPRPSAAPSTPLPSVIKSQKEEMEEGPVDWKVEEEVEILKIKLGKTAALSDIDRIIHKQPEYIKSRVFSEMIQARRNVIINGIDREAAKNNIHGIKYRLLHYPNISLKEEDIRSNGIPNEFFVSKQGNEMSPVVAALTDTLYEAKQKNVDQEFKQLLRANGALE